MTYKETKEYYSKLDSGKKARFNLLVTIAAKLGKPAEGCYDYAHTIMEDGK